MKADRVWWIWLAVLCLYGILHSATYALTNPPLESPDEPGHLGYVNRFAAGKGIPNQYDPKEVLPEGHQTPLYYFAAGEIFRLFGGPISVQLPVSNAKPPAPLFDHRPNPFPSSRDRNLFYGLRLAGAFLVGLTVLQTGRAAHKLMPLGHVWLVAPMIVATLPQLAFIGSSISNDGLVAMFAACVVYAVSCCAMEPDSRGHWILLGMYLGLAFLAKKNAIVLAPAALLFLGALRLYRGKNLGKIGVNSLLAAGVALLLFLPVFIHNLSLYGELLGNRMETDTMPQLVYPQDLNSWHFRYIFPHVVPVSFVAQFGWMVVEVKAVFVWRMVWFLGALGCLGALALFDRVRGAVAIFCFAGFLGNIAGLVYYNLLFPQAQGRLLFPSLACLAMLCALGLYEITSRVRLPYKFLALVPIAIWFLWFDLLCFYTNQNFYSWFGPALGF